MSAIALATDDDLAHARLDPEFRHQLLAENLELLLRELSKLRRFETNELCARQIREGVDLAVKLADLLQRIAVQEPDASRAA